MINKPITSFSAADLDALVTERTEESRHLDFKRELPQQWTDEKKRELCADVSSFANTGGGYLFFGVDENSGVASAVPGLQEDIDIDKSIVQLEQIIRTGIDPRLGGIVTYHIPTSKGKGVIAVHVPRSWRAPHLVKHGDSFRMYARTSRGKQPLDAQEIRRTFESTGNPVEAIRRWRDDRIAKILADDTPVLLERGAKLALHVVPLETIGDPFRFSVSDINKVRNSISPFGMQGGRDKINLDGIVTYDDYPSSGATNKAEMSYCQVFRSGRVETVSADLARQENGKSFIAAGWFETSMLETTDRYLKLITDLGISYPIVVMLSFLNAKGATMSVDTRVDARVSRDRQLIDRDVLVLPEAVLEDPTPDLNRDLRPMFDAAWNACGIAQSLHYDKQGNRIR